MNDEQLEALLESKLADLKSTKEIENTRIAQLEAKVESLQQQLKEAYCR